MRFLNSPAECSVFTLWIERFLFARTTVFTHFLWNILVRKFRKCLVTSLRLYIVVGTFGPLREGWIIEGSIISFPHWYWETLLPALTIWTSMKTFRLPLLSSAYSNSHWSWCATRQALAILLEKGGFLRSWTMHLVLIFLKHESEDNVLRHGPRTRSACSRLNRWKAKWDDL